MLRLYSRDTMNAENPLTPDIPVDSATSSGGLFRAILAGPGSSLTDAFASLERSPLVDRVVRHPKRGLLGARIAVSPEEGEGFWEFTRIRDEMFVLILDFTYRDPRFELVPGDGLVQFNFRLSGDLTMAVSRTEPLRVNRPSLLIWNQPPDVQISEWTAPSSREKSVVISVQPQFLLDHFLTDVEDVPPQFQPFLAGDRGEVNYCQLPLTAQMFERAAKLVDNPHTGILALIYTEAVVHELICSAVASISTLSDDPSEQYSERELRCLHAARAYIMKQLNSPPTIRQVARVAGMNETTLKKGFKAIFGETPFDFSVRCRMQHALVLLREESMSVARVAEAVGYRHQTSFATAFLRHFGMRPKDVRQSKSR